ncbi:hypothetical protein [Cochlodiniinecator piscidefendens]|uniref:hypothetical protein n=1 Tax=Cochlodiniinecator piscidefendens TaxID=2715756 RepID=UPI00140CDB75|nr:hypothetical protein [Cochlodiniinecator piscidefendens]
MTELLTPSRATDAAGFLPGPLGLRLDEEQISVRAVNARADRLDDLAPLGSHQPTPDGAVLRLWPTMAWAIGNALVAEIPTVDISHGHTHLRLRGVEALHFIANYTYADPLDESRRQTKALRTRLNHFDCVLWWTNTRDVHIVVDRSLAQSFCNHLRSLALRHDPADPSKTPRPVAPGAPDRRG